MVDDQKDQTNATSESTYQFGLRILFALPLFVVACFALAHWIGIFFALAFTIPAVWFTLVRPRGGCILLLIVYLPLGVLLSSLHPSGRAREAARRSHCTNNLKQIALALHSYHDTHGSFPPAYITDDEGRPMHSWRVLILPFLEQQPLYERYRFDEPWDGPNNIKLMEKIPSVFQCPSNQSKEKNCTNYVAVIGPHTAWPGDTSVSLSDIADGTSNTWLVVEVVDSGIAWTEPRDLHVLQMAREINAPAGQGISSKHPGGAQVVCADGSVRFVPELLPPKDIRAMLTIDEGDAADLEW